VFLVAEDSVATKNANIHEVQAIKGIAGSGET